MKHHSNDYKLSAVKYYNEKHVIYLIVLNHHYKDG